MHAPAAMSLDGYAVMSWQPLVVDEPLRARVATVREQHRGADQGGVRRGLHGNLDDADLVVRRLAVREGRVGGVRRHVDVEVACRPWSEPACGCASRSRSPPRRRTSGSAGSLMSKTRMPSQDDFSLAGCAVLLHESSLRLESTLSTSRSPVHRHVVLRAGADHLGDDLRLLRLPDVVDHEAVVVAGEGVVALERHVAVEGGLAVERPLLGDVGDQLDVLAARGLARLDRGLAVVQLGDVLAGQAALGEVVTRLLERLGLGRWACGGRGLAVPWSWSPSWASTGAVVTPRATAMTAAAAIRVRRDRRPGRVERTLMARNLPEKEVSWCMTSLCRTVLTAQL